MIERRPEERCAERGGGRLATESIRFAFAVAGILLNVAGQFAYRGTIVHGKGEMEIALTGEWQHGWPWAFASRESAVRPFANEVLVFDESLWTIWLGCRRFYAWALVADILVFVALTFLGPTIFSTWRSRRKGAVQLHLIDILAATAVVAGVCGYVVYERQGHLSDIATLAAIDAASTPVYRSVKASAIWAPGGPTWLRQLIGNRGLRWFDRVALVVFDRGDVEFKHLPKLRRLHALAISNAELLPEDLESLAALPELEALALTECHMGVPNDRFVDHDEMPEYSEPLFARLGEFTRLRALILCRSYVSAQAVATLGTLTRLESLDLSETTIDDEAIEALCAMVHLRELSLLDTEMTDAGLSHLGRMTSLESLTLGSTKVGDDGIRALRSLCNLRRLDLTHCQVSPGSVEDLQRHLTRCQIHWWGCKGRHP